MSKIENSFTGKFKIKNEALEENYEGGDISNNVGLLLLRQIDDRLQLTK